MVQERKYWTTGETKITNCDFCKEEPTIHLGWTVYRKVAKMNSLIKNKEWLGYLVGKFDKSSNSFVVTNIRVPDQYASGMVEVIDSMHEKDVIGTVHLHPFGGSPSFSGTDDKFIGGNHPMMIVSNNKNELAGKVSVDLPCGKKKFMDAYVLVACPEPKGLDEFADEALTHLKTKPPVVQAIIPYWSGRGAYQKETDYLPELYCAICHQVIRRDTLWEKGLWYHKGCHDNKFSSPRILAKAGG